MEKRGWLDAVLGLGPDWRITRVERTPERKELRVELARAGGGRLRCPHCGEACPGYDTRRRLGKARRAAVESVSMDMWGPYIAATLEMIPEALKKIAFDRFHVAKHLGDAVDKVRRAEHRALVKEGNEILTGSKYQCLKGRGRKTHREKLAFARLRAGTRRTAQAWELKEAAANLWRYKSRTWAIAGWNRWLDWASRCRLDPVVQAARMVREHLWGIVNAVISGATNGPAEGINSRIKRGAE